MLYKERFKPGPTQMALDFKITNICAKFRVKGRIDLNSLYENQHFSMFSSKKYNPNRLSALIAKYLDTKLTFLIFPNGFVCMTGKHVNS